MNGDCLQDQLTCNAYGNPTKSGKWHTRGKLTMRHFKPVGWLVGWLCLTSHRQRGHLETAPPFTVPCEGREAR